jgi:ribosome-binding protein aMBF1 (putative translation factor)
MAASPKFNVTLHYPDCQKLYCLTAASTADAIYRAQRDIALRCDPKPMSIVAVPAYPFGARLKQARLERGLSLKDFCERVGVQTSRVTGYENRGMLPRYDHLLRMARELDCSLDWLCGLED